MIGSKERNRKQDSCCGSLTIESALVIPLFCFALSMCLMIFQLMEIELRIQSVCMELCRRGAMLQSQGLIFDTLTYRRWLSEEIESEWLEQTGILSSGGIQVFSNIAETDWLELHVYYQVPIAYSSIRIHCEQIFRNRLWNGVDGSKEEKNYYYVTNNRSVFHTYLDCSYLQLNMEEILYSKLKEYQNSEGSRYVPCEICAKQGHEKIVYISKAGTSWHSRLSCYTLTRSIYRVESDKIEGLSLCSRCRERERSVK